MAKTLFISFLLFLTGFRLVAQEPVRLSFPQSCRVKWKADPLPEEANAAAILKEIAYDAVIGLDKACIDVSFDLKCEMIFHDQENCLITLIPGKPVVKGTTYIRGFDNAGILVPSLFNISMMQIRKSDSLVISREKWTRLPLIPDSAVLTTLIRKPAPADTLIVKVEAIFFDDNVREKFIGRIALINDYFASSAVLDSLNEMISREKIIHCQDMTASFFRIQELSKVIRIMESRNFSEELGLEKHDPKHFRTRYREMFRLSRSLEMTFRQALDTVKTVVINPECDPAELYTDHFIRYIRWSMLVNSRNGRIYEDYLYSFYKTNIFEDDLLIIKKLIAATDPSRPQDLLFSQWSAKVCLSFEKKINRMIGQYMFAEAARLSAIDEAFIGSSGYTAGNESCLKLKSLANNGVYNSYLWVAVNSMDQGKYNLAEKYLVRAQQYRAENPRYVTSDSVFEIVSTRLIGLKLAECDTLTAHGFFDEALACYTGMNYTFDSLTTGVFKREIRRKSDFCNYNRFRIAGMYYLSNGNMTDAGKFLNMACGIREQYQFPTDPVLDSLCSETWPFYMISLLRSREELIWMNRHTEARRFADSVQTAAAGRSSGIHPQLETAIAKFRKKIHDKACFDAQEEYEIYILRGQRNMEMRNYQRGNQLYDSALLIARMNHACGLDTILLIKNIGEFKSPANYQKQMKVFSNLISINEYDKAVDLYFLNSEFFRSEHLEKYQLDCQPLYDIANQRALTGLTLESVRHLLEISDYTEAMRFLKLLRMQEYPAKESSELQKQLARALATADYQPGADPVKIAEKYVAEDKWFTVFRHAYSYQWNIIKNERKNESQLKNEGD